MKYLKLETTDPYMNLAIEEYLFRYSTDDIFILWQNRPTVVIGKNQNAYIETNISFLTENNIMLARRITGGGAVYHDSGNLNYTFISKRQNGEINFEYFTSPVIEALRSLGLDAQLSGRNDILVNDRKISGNAQCNSGERVLHHGTLLFDSDLTVLSSVLNVDVEKIKAKALMSVRSRVTNIRSILKNDITVDEFIKEIEKFVLDKFNPEIISPPVCDEVDELYRRNCSDEWLYPSRDFLSGYNITRKKKYDFGLVSLSIDLSLDTVKSIKISGDFFGSGDITDLENMISGCKLSEIEKALESTKVGRFIYGMTNSDLLNLILND